jgi:hypothetical protein
MRCPTRSILGHIAAFLLFALLAGCASAPGPSQSTGSHPRSFEVPPLTTAPLTPTTPGSSVGTVDPGGKWAAPPADQRPGLATSFGESRPSKITRTQFKRQDHGPRFQTTMHYNNRAGLDVLMSRGYGTPTPTNCPLRADWQKIAYGLRGEDGAWLPAWRAGGRTYFEGRTGERYAIVIMNPSPLRREVVVSVDGLDTMDGQPASLKKRGYILEPGEEFAVEGFRTGPETVAAFRFGSVSDSYSEQRHGTSRNVGVIGLAVFEETNKDADKRDDADPFPSTWATPPRR